jgi:hypothetical protein
VCVLTDGKSGEAGTKADRVRRVMADYRAGKLGGVAPAPATFRADA